MADAFTKMFHRLRDKVAKSDEPTEEGSIVRIEFAKRETSFVHVVLGHRTGDAWEFTGVARRFDSISAFIRIVSSAGWEYVRVFSLGEAPEEASSEAENSPEKDAEHDPATCPQCTLRRILWGKE